MNMERHPHQRDTVGVLQSSAQSSIVYTGHIHGTVESGTRPGLQTVPDDTLVPCGPVRERLFWKVGITKSTLELKQDENLLECSVEQEGVEGAGGSAPEILGTIQLYGKTANSIPEMG